MNHMQTIVDYVTGWDEKEGQSTSTLRLRAGLALRVPRDNAHYQVWQRAIRLQLVEKQPLYIEFDATNSVKTLYLSSPRQVESLEQSVGRVVVYFRRAPSAYFVDKERLGAKEMLSLLEEAARTHATLLVAVQPTSLEILDVRQPER